MPVPTRPPPRENSTWETSAQPGLLQLLMGSTKAQRREGPGASWTLGLGSARNGHDGGRGLRWWP